MAKWASQLKESGTVGLCLALPPLNMLWQIQHLSAPTPFFIDEESWTGEVEGLRTL